MLELDLILERFLTDQYAGLDKINKARFIKLLETPDPELFAWLMGKDDPASNEDKIIVELIRRHVRP